jgi:prepilin-type N-terminal cleavage/methylation domain-containing protein
MDTDSQQAPTNDSDPKRAPRSSLLVPRRAFTLVELLVVITIIGILAALITVAAAGALKRAHQAQIKTEMNQLDMAFQTYRDSNGSYPPNCVDLVSPTNWNATIQNQVFTDLKRHIKQAFPRSRESDDLLRLLCGLNAQTDAASYATPLPNGMSAGEAIVFWLGGFSSDPKYPISGDGGPAYDITANGIGNANNNRLEPLGRKWVFPFATTRLLPRDTNNYFDNTNSRFIEYISPIVVNGVPQKRRINFWQYVPAKSEQPYLYFDVSRHTPIEFDPPANANTSIYAIKQLGSSVVDPANPKCGEVRFANDGKIQILHPGIDDDWGDLPTAQGKLQIDFATATSSTSCPASLLFYPTGPWTGELADTIVNFSEATLSASQK